MVATILFVDDDPNILLAMKRALQHEPFQIFAVTSAKEALNLLQNKQVDVVVSDEKMPGMSGTEFLAIVHAQHPEVVRIILTGHASIDSYVNAINEGEIYRFLLKPCSPALIALTIRYALLQKGLTKQRDCLPQPQKSGTFS
jgi:two-component system probable response regulator PhcQ